MKNGINMCSFVTIGNIYVVYTNYGRKFAAMAIAEDNTRIQFQSSNGFRSIVSKEAIIEISDLGLPKNAVI
ncbi:MAG: hypothetical protein PHG06_12425 [Parabacteroides sp.]|nr:hypothetical protein [Parabacteroides sp.]